MQQFMGEQFETQPLLDGVIGIDKGKLQAPGELSPDGGFSGAWQADEGDASHLPQELVRHHTAIDTIRWCQERSIGVIANNKTG